MLTWTPGPPTTRTVVKSRLPVVGRSLVPGGTPMTGFPSTLPRTSVAGPGLNTTYGSGTKTPTAAQREKQEGSAVERTPTRRPARSARTGGADGAGRALGRRVVGRPAVREEASRHPHPLAHTVGEHLVFPDRDLGLEGVDEVAARRERLVAVRRGRRRDDGEVADREGPGPVDGGHPDARRCGPPPSSQTRASCVGGARVGRVVEPVHTAPWSWSRTTPTNSADAPARRMPRPRQGPRRPRGPPRAPRRGRRRHPRWGRVGGSCGSSGTVLVLRGWLDETTSCQGFLRSAVSEPRDPLTPEPDEGPEEVPGLPPELERVLRGLTGGAPVDPRLVEMVRGHGPGGHRPADVRRGRLAGPGHDERLRRKGPVALSLATDIARKVVASEGDTLAGDRERAAADEAVDVAGLWLDAVTEPRGPGPARRRVERGRVGRGDDARPGRPSSSRWPPASRPRSSEAMSIPAAAVHRARRGGELGETGLAEMVGLPEGVLPDGIDPAADARPGRAHDAAR